MEYVEDIAHVEVHQGEEDQCLGEQFTRHGPYGAATCLRKPLALGVILEFGTNGISGGQHHEKQEDAGNEHRAEIDAVVGPGVVQLVQVDGNGLQESHLLAGSHALGRERGLACGGRTEGEDGLEVFVEQGTRRERCHRIIEGELGLPGTLELAGCAFGNQ